MSLNPSHDKTALLERIAALIQERLGAPEAEQAADFARPYYEAGNSDDLLERPVEDLYGAALCHWKLARQRRADEDLVHVYNPDTKNTAGNPPIPWSRWCAMTGRFWWIRSAWNCCARATPCTFRCTRCCA